MEFLLQCYFLRILLPSVRRMVCIKFSSILEEFRRHMIPPIGIIEGDTEMKDAIKKNEFSSDQRFYMRHEMSSYQ